jgi:hypothetical protein
MKALFPLVALGLLGSVSVFAAPIFAPGDGFFGGRSDGTSFLVGAAGTDGGATVYTDNVWPAAESPDHLFDGVGQKYLNFAELNTGIIVTPNFNGGLGSVVTSMQLWTANDAEGRDPATYELYGTNAVVTGGGPFALNTFTLISSGGLALPTTRNAGGTAVLDVANSQTVTFTNTQGYKSYMILFPTIKSEPTVNSMQIAEVQVFGNAVPEPGSLGLLALGAVTAGLRRRR